jgi:hypothetical protein
MEIVWFMVKAHRKWAFGFGYAQGITLRAPDQEKMRQTHGVHHLSPPAPLRLQGGAPDFDLKSTVSLPAPPAPPVSLHSYGEIKKQWGLYVPIGMEGSWWLKWCKW